MSDGFDFGPPVARVSERRTPLLGTPYTLEKTIGKGGMSRVYRGLHVELDRPVAIKLLNPTLLDHPEALGRLRREARLLARLGNPHVVDVYDLGISQDGLPYIAMQLLDGSDLRGILSARGPLDFGETVHIVRQVADALQAVHDEGLVHRDLKPENVLCEEREGGLHATVVDFGIAHIGEGSDTKLTMEGQLVGTPGYIAPELLVPGATPSALADQYSLGVLIYEMLTRRIPHEGDSALQILTAQHTDPPEPIGKYVTAEMVSKGAQSAIMKAISPEPEKRFESISDFMEALREARHTVTVLPATGGKTKNTVRNLLLVAALVGALAGGFYILGSRTVPVETVAEAPSGRLKVAWGAVRGQFAVYPTVIDSTVLAMELVTEPLIEISPKGQYLPRAAVHWQPSADGKSVVVELRQGAMFGPHPCFENKRPREATSADLSYSISLRNEDSAQFAPGFGPTEIVDEYRARITFERPSPFPEAVLASVFLVPKEFSGECDDPHDLARPVGTGPFLFAERQGGSHIRLDRNPLYWQKGVPEVEGVDIFTTPDELASLAGVVDGSLDMAILTQLEGDFLVPQDPKRRTAGGGAAPPRLLTEYRKRGARVYSQTNPNQLNTFGILFFGDGPHRIPEVRRAIAIGINRARLLSTTDLKMDLTDRYIDSRFFGYDPAIEGFGTHVEEAKKLVESIKAQHPALDPIVISAFPGNEAYSAALGKELDAIGLPHSVVRAHGESYSQMLDKGIIDAVITKMEEHTFLTDPLPVLLDFKAIGKPDPELVRLQRAASGEPSRKKRGHLYAELERHLLEISVHIPIGIQSVDSPTRLILAGPRVPSLLDPVTKRIGHQFLPLFSRIKLK